ncbi:MAG: hypothetical protein NT169_05935 [Chloroflexi bacterium]|nr:hypothetical protein [Chloroflexota bacterium]
MRPRVALAGLILIWLAASVGPAMAQGCDDCRELKQELRGGVVVSAPGPTPFPSPVPLGWPAATRQPEPAVRAMMFWMDTCPHCHQVLDKVLPPLQRQYGAQLQIHLLELTPPEIVEQFYQVAEFFGIPRAQAGVPLLVNGDRALLGGDQIAAELPGLIKQHLAAGGVAWPAAAGLARWAPAASQDEICAPTTPCADAPGATATPVAVAQVAAEAPASGAPQPTGSALTVPPGRTASRWPW